ncbi:MAG TPA: biosynthetic-type acetolactate synthase large subunit [Thermoleophilia bacterium]|nr:biosynthetic-type acetolactate synthase large subunit [Acidobacteriota bacterium]HOU28958.1 biosynthetic-type acetolactate synthase large subunit [Thermoleophilia bacterium]HQF52619.1 biosynthetic-type acetolactate synthase large subunit [Thermoleophilia bacterium]HQH21970.1 biosynthetic-type acetolactate synthase large subunit [Thermoleophilia bacterium]
MTPDKRMKGSRALVAALKDEGCEVLFGFPGGVAIPFYDALYDTEDIRHVLVRHEQGAAHAADGYARATGKVGVCTSTSGPGATNLVTGIATAYLDSSPLVAITWQVRSDLIGTDAFQEADITGITMPVVKHSYLVKDTADLPQVVHEAFHIASTGRPGPVVIDIPVDVALGETVYRTQDVLDLPGYKPTTRGHIRQIRAAAKAINEAERPVLYLGGGCISSGAAPEILRLAELRRLPVATTLMALGVFPETHELSMGMLGMHGTVTANYAVHECDLLINMGARFDDRVTGKLKAFAPHAKVIHADVDPAEIGKNVRALVPIVGDVKHVAGALCKELEGMEWTPERTAAWLGRIAERKEEFPLQYEDPADGTLAPQFVIEEIDRVTGHDAVVCTDVGQHQMWATQYYTYTFPRQFISSGGLGTMGFGLPAAIGAKIGRPDATVVDISGDGGFQMTMQELATAMSADAPVIVCILNNGYLGMVRQWQDLFWDKRYSFTDITLQPDFVKLAEAFGALGLRVAAKEEVEPALREALAAGRTAVIDFNVAQEENVLPMVPAGSEITEMIGGTSRKGRKKP